VDSAKSPKGRLADDDFAPFPNRRALVPERGGSILEQSLVAGDRHR